jgi:hypothetical protein
MISSPCRVLIVAIGVFLSPAATKSAYAVDTPSPPSLWDHNGSIVYLVADGALREFRYQEPRPAIQEAGARPGSLLFKGRSVNGRYIGTAYIFNRRCGQIAYEVGGPILDNFERVVLQGQAPRVGVDCVSRGYVADTLEFKLVKPAEVSVAANRNSLPPTFLGVWLDAGAENNSCTAAEWEARSGLKRDSTQLIRLTNRSLQGWEFLCEIKSVTPTTSDVSHEAIEVELFCSGEGTTWRSGEIWKMRPGGNRKQMEMTSLKAWDFRDNSGKPVRNTTSNGTTTKLVECN